MITIQELIEHYKKYFCCINPNTPDLRKQVYQLRYNVYIEECGYNPGNEIKDRMEKDGYDDQSLHSLIIHKPSKLPIGYIRLIPFDEDSMRLLPIEHFCKDHFDLNLISFEQLRSNKTGELSRMTLAKSFRRRLYDKNIQGSNVEKEEEKHNRRFKLNYLPMCLMLSGLHLARAAKVDYTLSMMECRLVKLSKCFGIKHTQIGSQIRHDGLRAPYITYTRETYTNLSPEYMALFKIIEQELKFPKQIE